MLADNFERFHIKLELHPGWRRCVRLKAAVIDLHVVNVLLAALLERRGNPCPFLVGGGTVLNGSRWSGLYDKKQEGDSSDNYLGHPSSVAIPSRGSSLEALSHRASIEAAGSQTKQRCFQSKELFSPWLLFASFSQCLASYDLH